MIFPFFARPREIQKWCESKGYTGTPYDCIYGYFQANTQLGARGTLYDYVMDALIKGGYSGSAADMLSAFFQTQTGVSGRMDSEKAFWANSSLDFFGGVNNGVTFNGQQVTFDGQNVTFTKV